MWNSFLVVRFGHKRSGLFAPAPCNEDPDPVFDSTRGYVEQVDRFERHQGKGIVRREPIRQNGRPKPKNSRPRYDKS
jgi:hypothetical protein